MTHATATISHLPGSNLQQALSIASKAAPHSYLVTHWQATACGTYHLHATTPATAHPNHALGVAKRIAQAWAEAGLCSNGRTSAGAALHQ